MRVLVSACLLGENCKYNGKNNKNKAVLDFLQGKEAIAVCPEALAGLGIPRPRVELREGHAVDEDGRDVDAAFRLGVARALARAGQVDLAILQPRSPTCGAGEIYDGSFSGRLIPGMGLLAAALEARGVPVVAADKLEEADYGL